MARNRVLRPPPSGNVKAKRAINETKLLRAELQKAMLIIESLWEMLREKHGLTDDDLYKKIYEIDMRDGTLDGKNQRKAVECPDCGHMVAPRHPACIYCGRVIDNSLFTLV